MIQVQTELALLDELNKVFLATCQDPNPIAGISSGIAHGFQNPNQGELGRPRKVGDFIQKEGASGRLIKGASVDSIRTLFIASPKKPVFQTIRGDGGAIEGNKRTVFART